MEERSLEDGTLIEKENLCETIRLRGREGPQGYARLVPNQNSK